MPGETFEETEVPSAPEASSTEETPPPPEEGPESEEDSPEKLIRALEREEEEAPSEKEPSRFSAGNLFFLVGIGLSLVGILLGGFFLWKLLHPFPKTPSSPKSPPPSPEKPVSKASPSSIPLVKTEFSLVLKHFLIPLETEGGAPVFVKASVILYFESQREVLRAKRIEKALRGLIYDTFRGIPFYYWRSPEGVAKIREALFEVFRTRAPEGLVPKEIEVRGYILK
ncbi:hypothetical protein FVE67_01335 [Thermosulfurimonas marina]|uniref:Flagellar protein FliL n=1 Tax=Thermosulfurimonas marina TaxID=2047767 RepID=A0A6H1WQS7_9BACT|nr:hypothetical protein [Thermosulfurimonas marina]QJA05518.1 hypothetical protein FVE67_01335 [Thermosulfurimonas marina]